MPTRILREGIITSEAVNSLSHEAELFYRRLMSVLDDYGRYFAHPSILRAACYPLQLDRVSEASVKQMLSECTASGLLVLYNDQKCLQCLNFRQQTRSKSKFPEPTDNDLLSKCTSNVKQMRSESESESYAKSESETGPERGAIAPMRSRFIKPTIEEVRGYCVEISLPVSEAEAFIDYYESNGWRVGRNPMKCWKAALRNWKKNYEKRKGEGRSGNGEFRNMFSGPDGMPKPGCGNL